MKALKLIKKIESNILEELNQFKGETVEIIILRVSNSQDREENKKKFFEIINKYSQPVPKWTREELYDRY